MTTKPDSVEIGAVPAGHVGLTLVAARPDGTLTRVDSHIREEEWLSTGERDFLERYVWPAISALRMRHGERYT
jgi:hypothetical protein